MRLIEQHHRRARLLALLWSLGLGLAACAAVLADLFGWWRFGILTASIMAIGAGAILVRWLWRAPHLDKNRTVRSLDQQWALKSRLETALELAGDESPLASAHRADTTRQVADKKTPLGWRWFSAMGVLCVALGVLLTELTIHEWKTKSGAALVHTSGSEAETPTEHPPGAIDGLKPESDTFSEITWLAPDAKSRATAVEEFWVRAAVITHTGLRNAVLRVTVNGGKPVDLPLSKDLAAKITVAGQHELELPIYLDELKVADFDVVSYYIQAERVAATDQKPVTSPLQFIQIRAAREDVENNAGDSSELIALLYELQSAQLQLLQQNFLLANTGVAHTDATWQGPNTAVAREQGNLSGKSNELRKLAIAQGAPALFSDNANLAAGAMGEASTKIKAEKNSEALPLQQRALAWLTECDRLIKKSLKAKPLQHADPFRDKQDYTLPERSQTPVGELEVLAEKQDQLLTGLGGGAGKGDKPSASDPKPGEAAVADEARRLSGNSGLSEKGRKSITRAADEATTALQRLAANDPQGALPAMAASAQALHEAVMEQEALGQQEVLAVFEQERRELNDAARNTSSPLRAAQLTALADRLGRAAEAQQQSGSARTAQLLSRWAGATHGLSSATPGDEAWSLVVQQAASGQVTLVTRSEAARRASRQLGRGKNELREKSDEGRVELELAAQIARELLPNGSMQEIARELERASATREASESRRVALVQLCEQVENALAKLRSVGERDERVRRFNPEEIEPAYRPAVEQYFQKLSREENPR